MPLLIDDPRLVQPWCACAEAAYPYEYCGVVLIDTAGRRYHREARNLLREADQGQRPAMPYCADPRHAFVLDPQMLLDVRRSGAQLQAIVHSHCDAAPRFSAQDAHFAVWQQAPTYPGVTQIIVSVVGGRACAIAAYEWFPPAQAFAQRQLRLLNA